MQIDFLKPVKSRALWHFPQLGFCYVISAESGVHVEVSAEGQTSESDAARCCRSLWQRCH